MSGLIKSVVEGIGQDILTDKANEYAGSHFQPTKDPFYEKITLPNGETKEVKRKLPKELFSKKESKAWKSIQNKAWMHDRSMCGCCCWTDTIGWAPLLALLPVIGPAVMYSIHNKLTTLADKEFNLPLELKAKMHGNIAIDLCISLIPILGTLFSWLHTCSTRNAAMVYNFIVQRALEQQQTNLQRDQVLQQTQQQQRQQMEKMKQNSNANNNSKNRVNVRNNQKENYEMRNLNSSSHNSKDYLNFESDEDSHDDDEPNEDTIKRDELMDDIFEIKAIVLQLEGASDSLKDALLKHPQVLLVKRFIEFISEPVVVCKWYSTGKMDGSRTFGKPLNFPGTETD
ncbi:hypothetical protein C6P44_002410 [Monosporozyma unispora]|nr:hypothetical protein C6P44_002410 [Kazachstania unispora]